MRKAKFGMLVLGATVAGGAIVAACGGGSTGGNDDGGAGDGSRDTFDQLAPGAAPDSQTSSFATDRSASTPATAGRATGSTEKPASGTSLTTTGGGLPLPDGDAATLERKIIFTANLSLSADDVSASFNEVGRLARSAGGFIEKSSLAQRKVDDEEERQYGSLTIRVPSGAYQDVLASLRTLHGTKLDREDSGSNEVTEEYADLQSRLRNLERSEAQYLKLLEQAKTIQEIITVNERVDGIRSQIEQVQGRLKLYDDLTDLATISVSLSPVIPGKVEPKKGDGPKSFSESFAEAWDWSLDAARSVAAASAVVLVGAIWLAIPAVIAFGGIRLAGRRRGGEAA